MKFRNAFISIVFISILSITASQVGRINATYNSHNPITSPITGPITSPVTPTPTPTNPPMTPPVPTITPTPINFFSNAQATGVKGYTCFRGCSSATTTIKYNDKTHVQEGLGSAKITIASNTTGNRGFMALVNKTLSAGVPIQARFYIWAPSGKTFTVAIRAKTSTGVNIDASKTTLKGNNTWQLVNLSWTTSNPLTQIGVEAYHSSSTGTSFWVDNLYISTK